MFGLSILVALVVYVYLAKVAVKSIEKRTTSKLTKYAAVAVFVLIPTWDIIPGRLYHHHVCEKEGGVKVYKTVEVDKGYFLSNGRLDEKKLRERLDMQLTIDRAFSRLFHITKHQGVLIDKENGEHLGTATDFWYYGGWLYTTILIEGSEYTCPQFDRDIYTSLWRQVVRPKTAMNLGGN